MTGGDHILVAEKLSKSFGGFKAVSDVDLKVRRHTIHALIGPNGAGKTTCFNLMTKFVQPTSGRILLNGHDITRTKPSAVTRLGMVRSFQISSVFPGMTVLENLRVALQRKLGISYHFWRSRSALEDLNERAHELIGEVGLETFKHRPASELSYGGKRALELATTIALDPEILLLDEPMAGMASGDINKMADLIRRVSQGRTVLMVEHNLSVVADLSDTITVLQLGQVLAEGSYEEVSQNPEVVTAYMGDEDDE